MNKIIIILSWIIFPQLLLGQAQEIEVEQDSEIPRAYIGAGFGPSISLGSFARKDNAEGDAYYANNGYSFQLLNAGYRFYKNLNAVVQYVRLSNDLDDNQLARDLRTDLFRYQAEASTYELNQLMIGVGFVKNSRSISLQMQMMLTMGNTFTPTIDLIESDQSGTATNIRIQSETVSGLGFAVGGGFRIHLNNYLDFITLATFINFKNPYDQKWEYPNRVEYRNAEINYEVLSLTFGFAYRFIQQ